MTKKTDTKDQDSTLDRDQQFLSRLAQIQHKVDSIEQTTAFALRADADKHFASAMEIFGKSKRRAQIYLAANGVRSVQEIAAHLKMQRQNVGPVLKILAEEGLLELIDSRSGSDIWARKSIDRTVRISKLLQAEFNLLADGQLSNKAPKKKRVSR